MIHHIRYIYTYRMYIVCNATYSLFLHVCMCRRDEDGAGADGAGSKSMRGPDCIFRTCIFKNPLNNR